MSTFQCLHAYGSLPNVWSTSSDIPKYIKSNITSFHSYCIVPNNFQTQTQPLPEYRHYHQPNKT